MANTVKTQQALKDARTAFQAASIQFLANCSAANYLTLCTAAQTMQDARFEHDEAIQANRAKLHGQDVDKWALTLV